MSTINLKCMNCSTFFDKPKKEYTRQTKKGRYNFFCSRSCACKYINENLIDEDMKMNRIKKMQQKRKNIDGSIHLGNTYCKKGDFTYHINKMRQRNKDKHQMSLDIDENFLQEMFNKQKGRCNITGLPMELKSWKSKSTPFSVSVDRLDNLKPYSKDNVHLVCYSANMARQSFGLDETRNFFNSIIY